MPTSQLPISHLPAGLTIRNLQVSYGARAILSDLSVDALAPGTLTALIGPNAAGKSTLMKAVAGLVKHQGAITLGDMDLGVLKLDARAGQVRFVPQSYGTTARLTVFDLLLVARMCGQMRNPSADDLAMVTGALERIGIAHLSDRLALTLSGGQQQLVALAQALTRPAPVLLLDEPTSALDLRHQLEAMAIMKRVAAEDGRIVVVALHDINLALRHADRILLMGDGRILADGDPETVLRSDICAETYGVRLALGATTRGTLVAEAYL